MSGTIPFSLSQQFDEFGSPLAGGKLYLIQAGTTSTPQNGYQDSALTLPLPNPLVCDAGGRLPQFFLADGTIKVRLTDKSGLDQIVADNILVVGPSSGSGGGGTVDPTTVLATGDIKTRYGTGTHSGWVRLNGRTIGSSTSGADERANADCQALFEYLWGIYPSTVVGGAGASANADWVANKRITLPDFRGRVMAGMDDMGNTAAGRLTFAITGTSLGYGGGEEKHTLTAAQIPSITSGGANEISVQSTQTNVPASMTNSGQADMTGGTQNAPYFAGSITLNRITSGGSNTINVTSNNTSGQSHNIVQPTITVTMYIKL